MAGARLNGGFDPFFTIVYRLYDLRRRVGAQDCKFASDVVWNWLESEGEVCFEGVGFVPVEACWTLCEEVVSKYFHFGFLASSVSSAEIPMPVIAALCLR